MEPLRTWCHERAYFMGGSPARDSVAYEPFSEVPACISTAHLLLQPLFGYSAANGALVPYRDWFTGLLLSGSSVFKL